MIIVAMTPEIIVANCYYCMTPQQQLLFKQLRAFMEQYWYDSKKNLIDSM